METALTGVMWQSDDSGPKRAETGADAPVSGRRFQYRGSYFFLPPVVVDTDAV